MNKSERIAAANFTHPANWDEMGSSEKDLWEDSIIDFLDKQQSFKEFLTYPQGTLLVDSDGNAYRARYMTTDGFYGVEVQSFTQLHIDGGISATDRSKMPEALFVAFAPKGGN